MLEINYLLLQNNIVLIAIMNTKNIRKISVTYNIINYELFFFAEINI